jgi:DNA replication licensing factor MCM3
MRLIINMNDLRAFNIDLPERSRSLHLLFVPLYNIFRRLMKNPRLHMLALQHAAKESGEGADPSFGKVFRTRDLQIGFTGSFGRNSVSPRGLLSSFLNNLVQVEGIVTKCSLVRPKIMKSAHYCPETKNYTFREYRDNTAMDLGIDVRGRGEAGVTSSAIPSKDSAGNALELELGFCQYKDYQTIVLQEMPERAKVGQLPRSVELILEHDLVDKLKPGDRVQAVGVYRPLPTGSNGQSAGIFKSAFICNNASIIGKEVGGIQLTKSDVENIQLLKKMPHVLDVLARSFCPSIFGHDYVKKALILQLLGGAEKNLENGTHLRGDINVMLVGDPSTAKSQLLRSVMDIAPLAISTTGRGSSGVGLTAAVTSDPDSRERILEAGAMVLADRGIVCIDEFDKMTENDRVAIHEVMEQQTVTIAKAGIHASLNARCSVLAAANPVYGQYDRTRRAQDNIGLPDSLLSRFDLLFIVLDQMDPTMDRRISEHVVKSHQHRRPGTVMEPEPMHQTSRLDLEDHRHGDNADETPVWTRGGKAALTTYINGINSSGAATRIAVSDTLTKEFLRKYIYYAKSRVTPVLSEEAMDAISSQYAEMRAQTSSKNLPITARSLETIIRLSSACAKSRLSGSVEKADVEVAMGLLNYVLFHEFGDSAGDSLGEGADTDVEPNFDNYRKPPASSSSSSSVSRGKQGKREEDALTSDEEDVMDSETLLGKRSSVNDDDSTMSSKAFTTHKRSSRYMRLASMIAEMSDDCDGTLEAVDVIRRLNSDISKATGSLSAPYDMSELEELLSELERENRVRYMICVQCFVLYMAFIFACFSPLHHLGHVCGYSVPLDARS